MADQPVYWLSPVTGCDVCGTAFDKVFYDAKTSQGPWACMCPTCQTFGPGLGKVGLGVGQKYELQENGRWLKTEG